MKVNLYSTLLCPVSKVLRYGQCVTRGITQFYLPPSPQSIFAFTPQCQGITTVWQVLTVPTHEGMARLS